MMPGRAATTDHSPSKRCAPRSPASTPHSKRLSAHTAAELASWKPNWDTACARAFADLELDPVKVRQVAALIPAAMRGITSERTLGTYGNLDDALDALIGGIVAYLEG